MTENLNLWLRDTTKAFMDLTEQEISVCILCLSFVA